jgi:predicted metalloprotease with PDZ domain
MSFTSLSSTNSGDGEIFYTPAKKDPTDPNQLEITIILNYLADHNVQEFLAKDVSIPDPPNFRKEVSIVLVKCDANKYGLVRSEYWDASNRFVRMAFDDPSVKVRLSDISPGSPFAALGDIFCQRSFAGIGIRLADDRGAVVAAEIFEGSPAAKAGVAANDIISHIDGEPVSGLTVQQAIEKIRGQEGTKVLLRIPVVPLSVKLAP